MLFRLKQALGIKNKVTAEELADIYWYICRKLSNTLDADIHQNMEEKVSDSKNPDPMFLIEQIIFNLWVISKACSPDRKVLDELHSKFIEGLPNIFGKDAEKISAIEELLNKRYHQYYAAWEKPSEGGLKLYGVAAAFLENICEYTKLDPINPMMNVRICSHIGSAMQFILETRKDYVIA